MKPMIVHSYEWHEAELETPHVGMYWPREYTTAGTKRATCPQCGNTWHSDYFEHGVCFDCWGMWGVDWNLPDIPWEE